MCSFFQNVWGYIPSGPVDLFTFNFVRRFTTPGEVTSMGDMWVFVTRQVK